MANPRQSPARSRPAPLALRGPSKPGEGSPFQDYREEFLRQGSGKFISQLDERSLTAFLRDRFQFFRQRKDGETRVRFQPFGTDPGDFSGAATLIEILTTDRPFVTDSIQELLAAQGTFARVSFHPILWVKRNAKGSLKAISRASGEGQQEVHLVMIVERIPEERWEALGGEIEQALSDVARCVGDFPAMSAQLSALQAELQGRPATREIGQILEWFCADNFIFLGLLPFEGGTVPKSNRSGPASKESGLGLLAKTPASPPHHQQLRLLVTKMVAAAGGAEPYLLVEGTDQRSRVHRHDFISVLRFSPDPKSKRRRTWAAVGLFTQHSLRLDLKRIPVIGERMRAALVREGLVPGSHKYKEALDFLNGMPKQELFRFSGSTLSAVLGSFLSVVDEPRVKVDILEEPPDEVRVVVVRPGGFFPPEKMAALRDKIGAMLHLPVRGAWVVRLSTFSVFSLSLMTGRDNPPNASAKELITRVAREEMQSEEELLLEAWHTARGESLDGELARTLIRGLPETYKIGRAPVEILVDLAHLEKLHLEGGRQLALHRAATGKGIEMVLYDWEQCALSRIMPILNNLRIFVVEEGAFAIRLPGREAFLQAFRIETGGGAEIVPETHEQPLRDLLFGVLERRLENDPLNALLFACGFTWRQVNLMMLLRNYLMQVGSAYTKRTINETLVRRPAATSALYSLFDLFFNPRISGAERKRRGRDVEAELADALREIDNLTEDRIYKRLSNLIRAAQRTNYFRDGTDSAIAIKFDSRAIDQLPHPKPLCEIYVHAPHMEAVHLRGGMIARGGIRYSDRPDDFRTEVLGLMDTQMKKNALIVPVGSKGGFVVKDLQPYGNDPRKAGDAQYAVFMRALLSVTDNVKGGRIQPPPDAVRRDGDDPYLVVAADKGTAHLSDTANRIALEEGFWLGDAFASGGSNGYDHKVVGITARGAWESVKRHFWEMGVNPEKEPVTVVGIGDMSGDVFGNGMLLSRKLKLVGAFNHAHIFLDPDPDPAASFSERERLFQRAASAWSDYDSSLISKGGGVFSRQAKAIPLAPEARLLLGTGKKELSGEEVIRALLTAEVDLILNGGIGTYIKAPEESDAEVGDHSNDAVRIDANECRAKVIAEGGNLGLTQAARIALDLAGTRINTDAIDNAGGVHMSDQEVNIKILLGEMLTRKRLPDLKARNRWLHKLEHEVTDTVIHRNYLQTIMVSMDRIRSKRDVRPFLSVLNALAAEGRVDRRAERIPNAQQFQQFQSGGAGIPRPVLSVLLSAAKMALFDRLVASPLPGDPFLKGLHAEYFPRTLRKAHDPAGVAHPLEKQIVATMVTNKVMDQAGVAFVADAAADTGTSWPEVARAYLLADEICRGPEIREQVYALDHTMPAAVQYEILMALEDFLAGLARELLRDQKAGSLALKQLPTLRKTLESYLAALPAGESERKRAKRPTKEAEWARMGLALKTARKVASLGHLTGFLAASRMVAEWLLSVPDIFSLEREIERQYKFPEIERALAGARADDPWRRQFISDLQQTVGRLRWGTMKAVLRGRRSNHGKPADWVAGHVGPISGPLRDYHASLKRALTQKEPDPVALAVVVGQLERL